MASWTKDRPCVTCGATSGEQFRCTNCGTLGKIRKNWGKLGTSTNGWGQYAKTLIVPNKNVHQVSSIQHPSTIYASHSTLHTFTIIGAV